MKPGVKFMDLFCLKNIWETTLFTAWKRQSRRERSFRKKLPELFINGKNTMTVGDIDQLKGHGRSALHGVEIATGRAEAAVAAERNKFLAFHSGDSHTWPRQKKGHHS